MATGQQKPDPHPILSPNLDPTWQVIIIYIPAPTVTLPHGLGDINKQMEKGQWKNWGQAKYTLWVSVQATCNYCYNQIYIKYNQYILGKCQIS